MQAQGKRSLEGGRARLAGAAASQAEKLTISVTAFDDICGGVFKAFLGEMTNYQQCAGQTCH